MKNLEQYIESGILELFVMGVLSAGESIEVETLAAQHPEIREEIAAIENAQEEMAQLAALHPPASVKSNLMAALDQFDAEREAGDRPPILNSRSTYTDFARWVEQPGHVPPAEYEDPFFIPLAQNEDGITALVWIQNYIPPETHVDVIEKFLIIEGSCDIEYGGQVHSLKAGDYLSIPLHIPHTVTITSDIPCKLIVQRIAA